MTQTQEFNLPDVGEGLTEAEIVSWHVGVGDTVAINDTIVDIETAKSVVELPSPFSGVVQQLLVSEGETVDVGTPIIVISDAAEPGSPAPAATAPAPAPVEATTPTREAEPPEAPEDEKPQVLVGPGPKEANARRRRLGPRNPEAAVPARAETSTAVQGTTARATPIVRQLARKLGVDLEQLAGLTPGTPITREAVQAAAATPAAPPTVSPALEQAATVIATGPSSQEETRIPVKGVRKMTAQAMSQSAFTAPHVTEWVTVDMTPTMDLVRDLKKSNAWKGVRINPLLFVARAFLLAIRNFPDINASWDDAAGEIVLKRHVNLGIAAATPRGLLVPNIKHADSLDLRQLAAAFDELVSVARSGKTQPADMSGGTVTITNIGALGVDAGTPILNPGESAILAFGTVRKQPWVVNDQIAIREVTQLAMSFDHRLVDGELGSNVLALTGQILANPGITLVYA